MRTKKILFFRQMFNLNSTDLLLRTRLLLNIFTIFCVVQFIVPVVKTQRVIVYPNPSSSHDVFIRDHVRDTLIQAPGGFSSFLCESCPGVVSLHTAADAVNLVVSWVDENGRISTFTEDVRIIVDGAFDEVVDTSENTVSTILVRVVLQEEVVVSRMSVKGLNWTQTIRLVKDARPPRASIHILSERNIRNVYEYYMRIVFTEPVALPYSRQDCSDVPLVSGDYTTTNVVEQSGSCDNDIFASSIVEGIVFKGAGYVSGVLTGDHSGVYLIIRTPSRQRATNIEISLDPRLADFAGNRILDAPEEIIYYRPVTGMPSSERLDRLRKRGERLPALPSYGGARALGKAATVAVAGSCTASLASSTSSLLANHQTSLTHVDLGSGSSGGSTALINNVQKMHMTGMLAVTNFPDSYKNFTDEVGWAVLDIDVPWKNSNKTNATSSEVSNTNRRSLKVLDASLEAGDDEDEFDYFERIMFWVPLLAIAVVILHVIILLVFFWKKWELPDIFLPPRLELMLAFFLLPPVAIAAAGLYQGDRGDAMLATWMIIAVPANFLIWNFFFLWYYILRLPPHQREANQITDLPSKKQRALKKLRTVLFSGFHRGAVGSAYVRSTNRSSSLGSKLGSGAGLLRRRNEEQDSAEYASHPQELTRDDTMYGFEDGEVDDEGELESEVSEQALTCSEIYSMLSNMNWLTLLFGEHQEEADWSSTRRQGSKFVARYGPLFEDHRGPAIGRKDVSLNVDPVTGKVDRGTLVIIRERPLLTLPGIGKEGSVIFIPRKKIYRYHLQIVAKLLDISKTILVGCIVAGVGNSDDNVASIIVLIGLSLILLFLFRLAKPFPSRLDMFLLLLTEVADLIVYTCALFLLLGPDVDQETYDNVGFALILSEGFALIAMIIEYTLISVGLGLLAWEAWDERHKVKFVNFAYLVLLKDGRYLEKKYFDRWMVKVFQKGLNGREPERHELPLKYVLKSHANSVRRGLYWLLIEVKEILFDAKRKLGIRDSKG